MSISLALNNALSGLNAASRMAEVVSSNLANAMTDGYGRRIVDLSAQSVGGNGAGVRIDGITRIMDRGILADRRLADASMAGYGQSANTLGRLERIVGATGDQNALSGLIASLEDSLVSAASDPGSDLRLGIVVTRFGNVTKALNDASRGVQTLRQEADASIAAQVDTLNKSLKQVEQLNSDIAHSRNTGLDPSALMDQRQQIVDKIAAIVPLRETDRGSGRIALMTVSGQTLIDGPAQQFGFTPSPIITPQMSLAAGGLSGITLKGAPLNSADGYGKLGGGSLGAAFVMRDTTLVTAQSGLDAVARDLVERFQDSGVDPTLAPGDAGLLTDRGSVFDPLDTVGLAGRISVNASIDPANGGALFRLRDGVNAVVAGPAGDASQINAWLGALSDLRPTSLGGAPGTAAGHAARLMAEIGGSRLATEEQLGFASARWDTLRSAELAGGVDSDRELQMLMQIEQSYAANARLVQTVESMMQTLMEL
jgi:flagellar hook-associated protein 1 FlgK